MDMVFSSTKPKKKKKNNPKPIWDPFRASLFWSLFNAAAFRGTLALFQGRCGKFSSFFCLESLRAQAWWHSTTIGLGKRYAVGPRENSWHLFGIEKPSFVAAHRSQLPCSSNQEKMVISGSHVRISPVESKEHFGGPLLINEVSNVPPLLVGSIYHDSWKILSSFCVKRNKYPIFFINSD